MWRERELDRALSHFRNYLRVRGYEISLDARLYIRRYMSEPKRINIVEETLRRREKTLEEATAGFSRLADESIRFARREDRTNVTTDDVKKAIAEVFCSVWPFCDGE
jgi:hypothetical protein